MWTGFEEIDAQHKQWLGCLNEFENAIIKGDGKRSLLDTLAFLEQYTNRHFSTEEFTMASMNSPVLAENKRAHAEFKDKLAEIIDWVNNQGASNVEIVALKIQLEEWVTHHICTIDIKLRDINESSKKLSASKKT